MIKADFSKCKILPPGGDMYNKDALNAAIQALPPVPGKRLKRNCPCPKCERWRQEREIRKMQKAMAESFTRMMNDAPIVFRTPIIGGEVPPPTPAKDTPDLL